MKKIILAISIVVLLIVNYCFTQDLPKTPAGIRAQEIIDFLNGTSSYELDDYINNQYAPGFRDAFPIAAHKGIFQTTKTMFGKLTVDDIQKSTENNISVVLKSESKDAWLNLVLQVEPDKPHRIATLGFKPGSRPDKSKADTEKKTINPGQNKGEAKQEATLFSNPKELDSYLLKKAENNEFSGSVLIAKDGKPFFQKAYGYASKTYKVPNTLDTKFNLGSINKIFTTVAITQLLEQGKLALDDPIGKYLSIFPKEIADKVTIRHLLNMRSGWGDYWENEHYLAHRDRMRSVSDYMEFIKDMPLDFEPGSNFQHSNTGFEVAGAIIEAISGMDYFDYIEKNIYNRAGMKNSNTYHRDAPVENLAVGYTNMNSNDTEGKGYQWNNTYMLSPRGTPAGGGYATAEDLLKYDIALRNNLLLNTEYTHYLISRFKGAPGDPFTPPQMVSRSVGGAPGVNAFLGMDFKSAYTIIVLSNYDHPVAMEVAENIIKMLGIE